MMEGHSGMQVITQLHDKLVEMESLTDKQKSVILDKLAVSKRHGFIREHTLCMPTHP